MAQSKSWPSKIHSTQNSPRSVFGIVSELIIAELLRAEDVRAEHPFLRNFSNPSIRVNLVIASPFERASGRTNFRPSAQTLGEGKGSLTVARAEELTYAIFSWRDDENLSLNCCVNN